MAAYISLSSLLAIETPVSGEDSAEKPVTSGITRGDSSLTPSDELVE